MSLLTAENKNKLRGQDDPNLSLESLNVVSKYFHPWVNRIWYAISIDENLERVYGIVRGLELELGYFSMKELEELKVKGLAVEQDLYFKEQNAQEVLNHLIEGNHV